MTSQVGDLPTALRQDLLQVPSHLCHLCHLSLVCVRSTVWLVALLSQNAKHLTGQLKTKDQRPKSKQTDILANIANDYDYDYSVQHEPSWWQLVASLRCLRPPSPFFSLLFLRFSSRSSQSIHRGFILIILVIIHFLVHSPGSIIVSSTRSSYRDGVKTQKTYLQNSSEKGKCNFLAIPADSNGLSFGWTVSNTSGVVWFGTFLAPKNVTGGPENAMATLSLPTSDLIFSALQQEENIWDFLASTKDDKHLLPDDFKLVRSSPHW